MGRNHGAGGETSYFPGDAASVNTAAGLARELGALDGAALVVSTVVGAGIFVTPGLVFAYLPGRLPFLCVWLAGGVLSVAGALAYAELARMYPRSGGEYVYIREAFGPLAGFLSGWTSFIAGFSGAVAAAAVGFGAYLGRLIPLAGDTSPLLAASLGPLSIDISPRSLLALAVIAAFTAIHLRGLGPGRLVQNGLAALSIATLVGLVAAGVWAEPMVGTPRPETETGGSLSGGLLALVLVMFTYSGWNAAAYVTEEVREPGRNIRRALLIGTGVVMMVYLAVNAFYLHALPPAALAGNIAPAYGAAEAVFGDVGAVVVTPLILLALAGSISAMVVTGPRVYFAMAQDHEFPGYFGRVSAAARVPAFAILAQAVWSAVLVVSGTFEQVLTYTGFADVLFAGVAVAGLFVLCRRVPAVNGRTRVPGYPFIPAAFVAACMAMVIHSVWRAPGPSLAGVLCIAAGIPLYWWSSRRAARRSRDELNGGRYVCD